MHLLAGRAQLALERSDSGDVFPATFRVSDLSLGRGGGQQAGEGPESKPSGPGGNRP